MSVIKIGTNDHGEHHYRIFIVTGTMWLQEFHVHAYNESEAIDLVADYCEEHKLRGLYFERYELVNPRNGETVDEYAEAHNLTCCGNHGIYIEIAGLEEL